MTLIGTRLGNAETYANQGPPGMRWDRPGGVGVVAKSPRSPRSGKPTAEGGGATRPSENQAIWDHLGMTEGKCFGILVDWEGGGVGIAVIARHRRDRKT